MKSSKSLYFQIKNETTQPIKAQLQISNLIELQNSFLKPQIIPPDKVAGFRVTFSCNKTKRFSEKISYILNDHHVFNIMVQAEVIPVKLDVSSRNIKFHFQEESLEMNIVEKIHLSNSGNDIAKFSFKVPEKSAFSVE